MTDGNSEFTDDIECVRCGETFGTNTERTMHVIRQRCPEINSEEDAESADTVHIMSELRELIDDE